MHKTVSNEQTPRTKIAGTHRHAAQGNASVPGVGPQHGRGKGGLIYREGHNLHGVFVDVGEG